MRGYFSYDSDYMYKNLVDLKSMSLIVTTLNFAEVPFRARRKAKKIIEKDWCDWALISRPYSILRDCLERNAEEFGLGFPNPWAEQIIFETHQIHFANCSLGQPPFSDPPEDVLLAMIIAPICLIPFLVTLVVWRSKDSEAQT
ncbi:receptor activity-modifying protein 2-like [Balaenoptera acutorostrata]|uniref:Receptor activity-modifying protein 2-like n=1 Tax=Balaenoptera acutorostrata TaxID=9767 RepID=A0ABM3U7V0_BALAC|nr:receptor activity-modifying protein 2-like [Balaenoptera acutorostrata]